MDIEAGSRGQHIALSAGIVMVGFVTSKLIGLGREVIIAKAFGTGPELDAYYAAFNIPDLLFTLIAGGALATAFIPVFTGYLVRGDLAGAWRLASAVFNLTFTIVTILALGVALAAPFLVARAIAPGFSVEQRWLTANLMRLILLSTVIFSVSGIVMGVLNAHQHFLLPAFAPAFYNLGIIGGALLLTPWMGIYGLALGVVIGAGLHLAIQVPGLIRYGMRYTFGLGLANPGLHQIAWLMGPRVLALGAVQLNFLISTNLASRLGAGSVSALNFGWLVMQLPESIFAAAVAQAAFPFLAELAARGQQEELRATLSNTLRAVLALTIPAMAGLIVLGRPWIQLLFQRGAFGTSSTEAVYGALVFYALGLIGHSSLELVARLFYAQKDTMTPLFAVIGAMVVNLLLSLTLVRLLGHGGLALANSIAVTLQVSTLLWLARKRLDGIQGDDLLRSAGRSTLATAVMTLVTIAFITWQREAGPFLLGLGGGLLGGVIYLVSAVALGSEEIRALPGIVLRKRIT